MLDPSTSEPRWPAVDAQDGALDVSITRPRPGASLLTVRGEIDTLTTPQLESVVVELLAGRGPRFVIDLSGVTFLASSGLAVLIRGAHRAGTQGARLRLVTATRAVRRPLEITGSDQLFDLFTDQEAAFGDAD